MTIHAGLCQDHGQGCWFNLRSGEDKITLIYIDERMINWLKCDLFNLCAFYINDRDAI